jgi:glycosyltransferase involved in cell wall biosynthesis
MSKPLVSIVTPSYNQGDYLIDTIESIRSQSYSPIEHIVVDGGSTDESIELLEQHENQYNLNWVSEPDEGQADAINKGFDMAEGEIIGWINSDDLYFDNLVVEKVVNSFTTFTTADVIYGNIAVINSKGKMTSIQCFQEFDSEILKYGNIIPQPGVFLRDYVVDKNKLNTDFKFCVDYEFWLRLSQLGYEFKHIDSILAGYRRHNEEKGEYLDPEIRRNERKTVEKKYKGNNQLSHIRINYNRLKLKLKSVYKSLNMRHNIVPVLE